MTGETVEKSRNIIQDIVTSLDDMGEKKEVKEEIDQISALRRDFDNLFSACKAYIDGLVASDVLVDDSVKHVSYSLYYESSTDHDRTIFDIEEST